jgi:hypothetical protein
MEIGSPGRILCLFQPQRQREEESRPEPADHSDGRRHTIQSENTAPRAIVHVDFLAWRSGVPGSISNAADLTIGAGAVSTRVSNDW